MKKLRKTIPGKRKQDRKNAEEEIERKVALFASHPTDCCVCKSVFERSKETVQSWQVTIRKDRVRLTCPKCWSIIQEGLERIQND